jgi:hypothetical protein
VRWIEISRGFTRIETEKIVLIGVYAPLTLGLFYCAEEKQSSLWKRDANRDFIFRNLADGVNGVRN